MHMCEVYWEKDFRGKIASGEWREEIPFKDSNEADKTFKPFEDYNGNWIVGTQEISWIENATNEERSRLHRYITDKGTIGGSGEPDPKRIRLSDTEKYRLTRPSKNEPCSKCGHVGHDWPKDRRHGK